MCEKDTVIVVRAVKAYNCTLKPDIVPDKNHESKSLFQASVKVMVPVERLSFAFVFPNTFFNAVSSRPTVPHATLD